MAGSAVPAPPGPVRRARPSRPRRPAATRAETGARDLPLEDPPVHDPDRACATWRVRDCATGPLTAVRKSDSHAATLDASTSQGTEGYNKPLRIQRYVQFGWLSFWPLDSDPLLASPLSKTMEHGWVTVDLASAADMSADRSAHGPR